MAKEYFKNVKDRGLPSRNERIYGQRLLEAIPSLQIGSGGTVFRGDQSGIWLGANKFANAPFKVDMDGNLVASSATLTQYPLDADVLKKATTGQTLSGDINVGSSSVLIDGANNRIVINDGTTNRIVIGDV